MARFTLKKIPNGEFRLYQKVWFPPFWIFIADYKVATNAHNYVERKGGTLDGKVLKRVDKKTKWSVG